MNTKQIKNTRDVKKCLLDLANGFNFSKHVNEMFQEQQEIFKRKTLPLARQMAKLEKQIKLITGRQRVKASEWRLFGVTESQIKSKLPAKYIRVGRHISNHSDLQSFEKWCCENDQNLTFNSALYYISCNNKNDQQIEVELKSKKKRVVNQVIETDEYSLFVTDSSHEIIHVYVERLKKSMQENYLMSPIIVNENMMIIDGYHRFRAAQQLYYPIRYIKVEGYALTKTQKLNALKAKYAEVTEELYNTRSLQKFTQIPLRP